MNPLLPQLIETAELRANPAYELVLYDRLPAAQQQVLHGIQDDLEFYGILRPYQVNGLSVKSVNQDTALLFLTLQVPGKLPGYVQNALGSAAVRLWPSSCSMASWRSSMTASSSPAPRPMA
jgi:hypothetical protein